VFPEYEKPLIQGIRNQVSEGDEVVIVGGGLGVSSVVAAQECGPSGGVITYEAGRERAELAREVLELSGVEEIAEIREAVVGTAIQVEGEIDTESVVHPDELPECDVLVLDCEGAELEILQASTDARALVVETHEFLDSSEQAVRELLDARGYEVVDRGVEVEDLGVYVLTALSRDRPT
jgi:tRNA A58 N-methylase Trm61